MENTRVFWLDDCSRRQFRLDFEHGTKQKRQCQQRPPPPTHDSTHHHHRPSTAVRLVATIVATSHFYQATWHAQRRAPTPPHQRNLRSILVHPTSIRSKRCSFSAPILIVLRLLAVFNPRATHHQRSTTTPTTSGRWRYTARVRQRMVDQTIGHHARR